VSTEKRSNVRRIADKLGSPNRLRDDLAELTQKRCLHMEREGKEHIYTITNTGKTTLMEHQVDLAHASIASISEVLQQIQIAFSHRISAQSFEEYGRIAQKVLPNGPVDDDAQREADAILSNQPLVKTSHKIAQLVMIAHDSLAKIRGDPPGLRDAYIRACVGGPADELGLGGKRPEIVLTIKSNNVVEAEARDAFTLEVIKRAAAKNPTLMRLLKEIVPDLEVMN
jgi:hypothetical protein